MPGGKIEEGEYVEEAIVREFSEEVGHPVKLAEYCAVVDEEIVKPDWHGRLTLYVCKVEPSGTFKPEPHDLGEEGAIGWFPVADLPGMKDRVVPSDYRMQQDILAGGGRGYYKCRMTIDGGTINLSLFKRVG